MSDELVCLTLIARASFARNYSIISANRAISCPASPPPMPPDTGRGW